MTIDEEVAQLEKILDGSDDTHPDYLPQTIKDLRQRVFSCHGRLSAALENRLLIRVKESLASLKDDEKNKAISEVARLTRQISFRVKLELVVDLGDMSEELERALIKANSYRNEFAHIEGFYLRPKYNYQTSEGKQKYRDTLRALVKAEHLLNEYWRPFLKGKSN